MPYFHNVFTLPHELNALILYSERNQRALLTAAALASPPPSAGPRQVLLTHRPVWYNP